VDLHKIPKLYFEGERASKRGLTSSRQPRIMRRQIGEAWLMGTNRLHRG
jgi:hypothetical protein